VRREADLEIRNTTALVAEFEPLLREGSLYITYPAILLKTDSKMSSYVWAICGSLNTRMLLACT